MRLFGRFKKPQAPPPIIFTPDQQAKLAELVDDSTTYQALDSDPIKTAYPSLVASTTPITRLTINDSDATIVNKRMYAESVRNVLLNKLRSP